MLPVPLPAPIAGLLGLDELLALAAASMDCRRICSHAACNIDLQALGGRAASTLRLLTRSSLTSRGASIRQIRAVFCKGLDVATLRALPAMPALQVLNLDGCHDVDDDGIVALAQRCKALTSISLYWNVRVTDKGFGRLLKSQQGDTLIDLSFSGCKNLSDETVQRIVSRGSNLEILDLTRCPQITNAGVLCVSECLEKLRVFRLYAMAQLSPQAFTCLHKLTRLEELDLCGCRLEDASIVQFLEAANPSKLHTLNLTWCANLTDMAAIAVANCCPRLVWLSYFGSTTITAAAVHALASSACGPIIHSLDVRGLTQAAEYSKDATKLRELFPALVETELHH
eukprot:TRINITY_DN55930_c0_g1_i1.p1 TRINITY_DN55930_c0_g1~~TRINITY_DN55930_c0_g1_i1.p1  ORF type:complete len:341 (+),score=52.59 TRINITY_DN55930_c0_g1_i1:154-1176(+)